MPIYTFIGLGHDGTVATVDGAGCADDDAAIQTGRRLFDDAPNIWNWPNCQIIDVYQALRLVHQVRRAPA